MAKTSQPSTSQAPTILTWITGGVLTIATLAYFGPLWVVPAVATLIIGAIILPPPAMNGPRQNGHPTALPEEEKKLAAHRRFKAHGWDVVGRQGLIPNKQVRLAFLVCLGLGIITIGLPSVLTLPALLRIIMGVLAFTTTTGFEYVNRTSKGTHTPYAGTMFTHLTTNPTHLIVASISGIIGGGATGIILWVVQMVDATYPLWAGICLTLGVTVTISAFVGSLLARKTPVSEHKAYVQAAKTWDERWVSLQVVPAPNLKSHQETPWYCLDEFVAPTEIGAAKFTAVKGLEQVARVLSTPIVQVLPSPAIFESGPSLDQFDQNLFRVVTMDNGYPNITDPEVSEEDVMMALQVAFSTCAVNTQMPQILVGGVENMTLEQQVDDTAMSVNSEESGEPDEEEEEGFSPHPAGKAWNVQVGMPEGPGFKTVRSTFKPMLESILGVEVEVDHRAEVILVGALHDAAGFADNFPVDTTKFGSPQAYLDTLAEENEWDERWSQVLKTSEHAPTPQFPQRKTSTLAGGQELTLLPFMARQGMTPTDFTNLDSKLATTLRAAPFTSVTLYSGRAGVAHAQAFSVIWSHQSVPMSPDALKPKPIVRGVSVGADAWLITALVEKAFTAAKLPRPLVTEVYPLTKPRSRSHVWAAKMRLQATTLEEVRKKIVSLSTTLATAWLRVASTSDEGIIEIFMGGDPTNATFMNPETSTQLVAALDWEAAWAAANVVNFAGQVPTLTGVDRFPHNQEVQILDFALPSSISVERVRAAVAKLKTNTGNEFLEVLAGIDGPATMRIHACRTDPMPTQAPFDMNVLHEAISHLPLRVPIGTGVTGEPIFWDMKDDPHIKVIGRTGGGKSVGLQIPVFAFLLAGAEVVIIDVVKKAADFDFARPYAKAVASDYYTAAGVIDLVYEEVKRRVELNSTHGVGNIFELPNQIQPRPLLLVIDEFTSLIKLDSVPPASTDLEVEEKRQEILALNAAKQKLGTFAGKIGREARSAGVNLALGGQKLGVDDLAKVGASELKGQMSTVFVGKPKSQGDLMSALSAWEIAPDVGEAPPPGRGMWESFVSSPELMQVWFEPGKQAFFKQHLENELEPPPKNSFYDLSTFTGPAERGPLVEDITIEIPAPVEDLGVVEIDWDDQNETNNLREESNIKPPPTLTTTPAEATKPQPSTTNSLPPSQTSETPTVEADMEVDWETSLEEVGHTETVGYDDNTAEETSLTENPADKTRTVEADTAANSLEDTSMNEFLKLLETLDWDELTQAANEPFDDVPIIDVDAFLAPLEHETIPIFDSHAAVILDGSVRIRLSENLRMSLGELPCEIALAGAITDYQLWAEDLGREDLVQLPTPTAVSSWCASQNIDRVYYAGITTLNIPGTQSLTGPVNTASIEQALWKTTTSKQAEATPA